MDFKDHFSKRAVLYSRFRPTYPGELFEWIAALVPRRDSVWDCATGSGQAAVGLARHFRHVIATDASASQIAMTEPHPDIEYRVASAYESEIANDTVDAVTVAQAIHWLDHSKFYHEARRVLKPEGLVIVWGYGDPVIDDPVLEKIVHDYNRGTIEKYWKPERNVLLEGLRTIPFPFREVPAPSFIMQRNWSLEELTGYLRTWSASAAYAEEHGGDPVAPVEALLRNEWGTEPHLVTWPLFVRAGFV